MQKRPGAIRAFFVGGEGAACSCSAILHQAKNLAVNFRYDDTGFSGKLMRQSACAFMARHVGCRTNTGK
jgi:hypothetical protein